MNKEHKAGKHCHGGHGRHRRGPTSYGMHDSSLVFKTLALQDGNVFLDLGCGPGDYSIHAGLEVGPSGRVYAFDSNNVMLEHVKLQAEENGLKNVSTYLGDMTGKFPFEDGSVDTCFMSTSLHCMNLEEYGESVFTEVRRVLKTSGQVAVLECKKERTDFGPPLHMRISGEELRVLIEPLGFTELHYIDLGFNYLICFRKV
ncbi:class I SAM-dependent methyltransferase [Desulfovibrio sp. JC022]|uniref:class I SAM-dependent methyltransferase n=1 Tax=Desulfovibrio sp. JC022 TaxID=2593642 RepID=UPI0013D84C3B|nr:class I SAM-dependent methyltransferase [Desulfovibrio sp. JC022]NDV23356.1 class I SAM-dependent methyltransferase [Desulfovibrio sp. JC022]